MHYLKLIRYQNLLLLAFMQLVFRYGFLKLQDIPLSLTHWQYGLLVLATLFIAAGGYIINDINDVDGDLINKPTKVFINTYIDENKAFNLYLILTIAGVAIGYYLCQVVQQPSFIIIFIAIASLLYFYATTFKKIALLGNFIIALILMLSVLIIGVFDVFPATWDGNKTRMTLVFGILIDYAVFAFLINFIREIVKDLEDVKGDYNQGMRTLPIIFGVSRTTKLVFVLVLISIGTIIYYVNQNLMENNLLIAICYILLTVVGPLIYVLIKITKSNTKKEFHLMSTILKAVIFFGILSITVITLNIKHA